MSRRLNDGNGRINVNCGELGSELSGSGFLGSILLEKLSIFDFFRAGIEKRDSNLGFRAGDENVRKLATRRSMSFFFFFFFL